MLFGATADCHTAVLATHVDCFYETYEDNLLFAWWGSLVQYEHFRHPTQDCRNKNAITSALSRYDERESTTVAIALTVTNTITGLLLLSNRARKTIGKTQTRMMICLMFVFLRL